MNQEIHFDSKGKSRRTSSSPIPAKTEDFGRDLQDALAKLNREA